MENEHGDVYAYIIFLTSDDAQQAMQRNGNLICGQPITLSLCLDPTMVVRDIIERRNIVSRIEQSSFEQGKIVYCQSTQRGC